MRTRLEEIRGKYLSVKRAEIGVDPLSLKREIESFADDLRASEKENEDLIAEAQDMLIDLTKMVEEGHCQPFRAKGL